jgi:hypothetical protein
MDLISMGGGIPGCPADRFITSLFSRFNLSLIASIFLVGDSLRKVIVCENPRIVSPILLKYIYFIYS